ncbi:hypothetical protein WJX73_004118 [Symbiochloris irregularis]|uniref:Uncharacterized protein n=1 Tax=Symbiochloris irregularis TaxID=706552 RepID=A0AAW1PUP2_9CHLO
MRATSSAAEQTMEDGNGKIVNEEAPNSSMVDGGGIQRKGSWFKTKHKLWDAPDLQEHIAWKRSKLSLLTIGVAVVLVANVTFLGFLTPPQSPAVPLLFFDEADNTTAFADSEGQDFVNDVENPSSFIELLYNKAFVNDSSEGYLDLSKLTLADYASLYTVVNPQDFCENSLDTAFRVVNGFAFIMSVAAVFVVAVLPLFTKRNCWDLRLARLGAVFMTVCLLCFLVAFLLAGFITSGKGINLAECNANFDPSSYGKDRAKTANIVAAGTYATVGLAGALVVIVIGLAAFI